MKGSQGVTAHNKQTFDTRIMERELLSSFNAVCSVLVIRYYRSQKALRKAADIICSLRAAEEKRRLLNGFGIWKL